MDSLEEHPDPIDYDKIQAPQFVDFASLSIQDNPGEDPAHIFFQAQKAVGTEDGDSSPCEGEDDQFQGELPSENVTDMEKIVKESAQRDKAELKGLIEVDVHFKSEITIESEGEGRIELMEAVETHMSIKPGSINELELIKDTVQSINGPEAVARPNEVEGVPNVKDEEGSNNAISSSETVAKRILSADHGNTKTNKPAGIPIPIAKKLDARVTVPKPFQFQYARQKSDASVANKENLGFKSRPAPIKMFYGGPTGLKEKPEAKITVPVTPKFASDARIRSRQMKGSNSGHDLNETGDVPSSRTTNEVAAARRRFRSMTPVRSRRSPSPAPKPVTIVKPFSFEEREKEKKRLKEERLRKATETC